MPATHLSTGSAPLARTKRGASASRVSTVRVRALFGKKDPAKEAAKQAEWEAQQAVLEARRAGKALESSKQRRAKVSQYIEDEKVAKKKAWSEGKNVLLPGQKKSGIAAIREQYGVSDDGEQDENKGRVGFVLPMNSIGMPKYDQGSRFDLEAPYADEGYVDESDKGGFNLGRILGFGKNKEKKAKKNESEE
eukprot:jgi/Tetstr1/436610/TSEL_025406.t1